MESRRAFLAAAGTAATAGLAGCASLGGDGGDGGGDGGDGDPTPDPGSVASAPVPDSTDEHQYAIAGSGDAPVVTYYGNWKCPFCAQFSTGESDNPLLPLGTVVEEYVAPGDVSLRYRALSYRGNGEPFLGPDAPRAGRAGLAVWTLDPGSYWAFHEHVMANQPPESEEWATVDRLVSFAEEAGVGPTAEVRTALESGDHEGAVRANTEAAGEAGVRGTPTLVVDGSTYSPFRPDELRGALDALSQ